MAITTIDNLTEITEAGANDVLPISTANGARKIKASALGGGGAGEVIEVTMNMSDGTLTTNKKASEIMALYTSKTPFSGIGSVEVEGTTMYFQLQFGTMAFVEGSYMLAASLISFESTDKTVFSASSGDSVMVGTMGS